MNRKIMTTTMLAAALVTSGVGRAHADFGDALAGGIVGGLIVGAITNESRRSRPAPAPQQPVAPQVSSAARQMARDVQIALNHFYFNVGTPDGVLGRQSRAGISQYQAYLGFPVTGDLSEFERQVLITAYQRAMLGGAQVVQVSQSHPDGLRGMLPVVRDEMLGVQTPQGTLAAVPQPQPIPQPQGQLAAAPAMPNLFAGGGGTPASLTLSSHCNRVNLISNASGGPSTLQTMTNPELTLNEQFCLARGYAIAEGETLAAQLGASPQAVAQQCAGLEPLMQGHVAALGAQPRDVVLGGVMQFVMGSGQSMQDLAGNARVCLSSGYATDNMNVALGSALILVALGETAYGELPAHHLMTGIGTPERQDLAADWFRASVPVATGATPVAFQPGPASRNALILAAVDATLGAAPAATMPAPIPAPSSNDK